MLYGGLDIEKRKGDENLKDVKLIATVLFLVGAWQLDVLVSPLIFALRDQQFYFWFGSISFWDAYALFFWSIGIAFFISLWATDLVSFFKNPSLEAPKVHFDFGNPTHNKKYIIAILMMLEAFLFPLSAKLALGEKPTEIEIYYWIALALMEMVTFFLAFMRGEEVGKEKSEANDRATE